mgnify:CR=1 FL=1
MFADPVKNLKALGLREDDIVADLGAGTGFYTLGAGHLVRKGKVYAVEVEKDFLAKINSKIKEAHLHNVEIIWGNVEKLGGTKIKDGLVDIAIASNILFQVEHKENFISEIKRILKKGGRVLLVDWADHSKIMGAHRVVPKAKARELFESKSFIFEREINTGLHHYGMIFKKG